MATNGNILIVDDDALLTESIRLRLEQDGYATRVATTGGMALALARHDPPDLVLLDIGLPDSDGLDLCRALQRDRRVPVIFLTGRTSEIDKVSGLVLGDDYVTKPFSMVELEARIALVFRRLRQAQQPVLPEILDLGGVRLDPSSHQVLVRGVPVELTPKEFDLLHLLMSHAGQVLATNEILSTVWGSDYTGAFELVYVHISWLRQKLCLDSKQPRLIHTIRGVGYRFAPEEP